MRAVLALAVALCIAGAESAARVSPVATFRTVPDGRIVGGRPAVAGEADWQISLVSSGWFGDSHRCGGSLVGTRSVVTAAHCTDGLTAADLKVKYGGLDRTNLAVTQTVQTINQHTSYDSVAIDWDYSVLNLPNAIQVGGNVKTIELVDTAPANGAAASLTGWGYTVGGDTSTSPTVLQYVDFKIVSATECNRRYQELYGGQITVTERMICSEHQAASGCNGDSGGPLVSGGKLAGIVSWGIRNCPSDTTKTPAAYADVANQRAWLISKIV
jgi:trypsin